MSKNNIANDLVLVLNGFLKVVRSGAVIQRSNVETVLRNSNVRKAVENAPSSLKNVFPSTDLENSIQRASMIPVGISQFASIAPKYILPESLIRRSTTKTQRRPEEEASSSGSSSSSAFPDDEIIDIRAEDLEGLYIQSLGVEILQQNEDGKRFNREEESSDKRSNTLAKADSHSISPRSKNKNNAIMDDLIKETSKVYQMDKITTPSNFLQSSVVGNPLPSFIEEEQQSPSHPTFSPSPQPPPIPVAEQRQIILPAEKSLPKVLIKPLSKKRPVSQLSETSKQRKVPSTRISRLVSYGGLAAGLGFGALAEVTKRSLGIANQNEGSSLLDSSPFLTDANATRIVDTLCRVRGAALKIGQILSIQDNSMINPQLQKVFERVRHGADFMPDWQMERMMVSEMGIDWRLKLTEFDPKPFAAASIGQVHLAKLPDGRPVAIKIQYPGVGDGINSDIDNLISVLNVWKIIPDGVFIDNIITVAKRELSWEVDYIREAKCAKRFRKLLEPYPDYYVPDVIGELTTKQIYTTELIEGLPVDQCENLDQETRNRICFLMLNLFFRELFEFQFMQTDPNWANFLYNTETKQIGLLDFGSSREYSNSFVDKYMKILEGAAAGDREKIIDYSIQIGFLSGYESKLMENAHTDTVLLLGEAFRIGDEPYDFGRQDITLRIQRLVPVMVKERLVPPPEEIYSLHRKLSGIFLLCSRLRGKVQCREILKRVQKNYQYGRPDVQSEL